MKVTLKKNSKITKTQKVTGAIVAKVKAAKAKVTKAVKATFQKVVQGYRVWKRLDESSYRAQGHGTIANLRHVEIMKVDQRGVGQAVILHKSDLGYGYTHGALIENRSGIHAGLIKIKFDAKQIVAVFNKYSDFVSYVKRNGELNVSGTEKWRTLSNGGRYSLYTDGKQVIRFESAGSASGHYHDFQKSGKYYGSFKALKTT